QARIMKQICSHSVRAELPFPKSHVDHLLWKRHYARCLSSSKPVFLAATFWYLTVNILELAGNEAHNNHRRCVIPEHVEKVMYNPEFHAPLGMCPSFLMMRCSDPGRTADVST
uniref:Histone H2A n=1 Tax=Equus asinus TaxID=9793 RepID=A0A8C4L0S3_EQUAS